MKKIPMLEKFAAQSLVELDGELIFSKEKFAELIVGECADIIESQDVDPSFKLRMSWAIKKHLGVE